MIQNGIQLSINEAIRSGLNNNVVFDLSTYKLSMDIIISDGNNLTITGQGIDKTFLIGSSPSSIFSLRSCQGLITTSLSIDFDPFPFTVGYVFNINGTHLDLQVTPPHQTNINQQIQTILRYDPIAMRPAFGSNDYEIYQTPSPNATTTTLVSPGILRIPLNSLLQFFIGDPIVVRYAFRSHVIDSIDDQDLTIQSINIYTSRR
jgi:hypothetical protein